jgi:predicted Zn-dependent protease
LPVEARDERFIEFAVASGHLDGSLAHHLYELKKQSPLSETIEQLAVKLGFLTDEKVQKVIEYARGAQTQADGTSPTSPAFVSPTEETQKDDPKKPASGKLASHFGTYEILGEIARGGMGVVYRASRDGVTVALKVLLDEKNPSEATVHRFNREIRAGREINHPNVVHVFDAGAVDGRLYFTMELVDGRSLDKLLPDLQPRQKFVIFQKIARAVHAAHSRGFIHRDLKPQNVLITKDLEPKVADFGLAKSLDRESRLTKTGAILGTLSYMSPEQAEGGGAVKLDARTDVWALGAMLYEMLAGTVPFKAPTQFGTIGLILASDPEHPSKSNPEAPADLSTIALKCLEKEPDKRFSTAAEVSDEVGRWLAGTAVSTHAPGLGARLGRWVDRRKLPLGALLLTSAVSVGTMQLLSWKHERDREALLAGARARAEALLADLAKPGATAELADRLDAQEAAMKAFSELDEMRRPIAGAALVARKLDQERPIAEVRPLLEAALARAGARWDVRRAYASALERGGDFDLAERCIAEAPARDDPAVQEALGVDALELGDLATARAAFERAGPSGKALLARTLALQGDPGALAAAKALPPSDETQLLQAEALLATDAGLGIDSLRMLERTRKTPEVALRVAQALLRLERADESIFAFARARRAGANPVHCLLGLAEAQLLAARPVDARGTLDEAAQLAPKGSWLQAHALARRARIEQLEGGAPSREVLAARPRDPALRLVFAGDDAAELQAIATELGSRPEAVSAWCALARLRERSGDPAAKEAIAKALEIAPASEEALAFDRSRARAAFAAGHGDGARLLRQSTTARKAELRWRAEEAKRRAETLLSLAERAAPWSGGPLIERGAQRVRDGAHDEGATMLRRGLELSGEDPQALGVLALTANSPADAADYATRLLALEPENALALGIRGKARLFLGHPKEALEDVEHAQRIDNHDPEAWSTKAAALEKLGRPRPEVEAVQAEAALRHDALRVAQEAIRARDFARAFEYAPDDPTIVAKCVDAIFMGSIGLGDPFKSFARILPTKADAYLNRIFDRTAIQHIVPGDLAPKYETPDGDSDDGFTGFILRCIGIVRERDLRSESLGHARLDLERCIAKDPSALVAVGARGFVLAIERQTELAEEDLGRTMAYAPDLDCFIFAHGLIAAQKNQSFEDDRRRLAEHEGHDEFKAFTDWLPRLAREGR